ncbi:MAG: hypothetical protein II328_02310 [Clostridia bacterium]|nr:hypothetical protein [Clostridia bacterium]
MNILVFSRAAWDPTNSLGNTVTNFFSHWTEDVFSHFYTRKSLPKNDSVSLYYNVSATDVPKDLFRKKRTHCFTKDDLSSLADSYRTAHEKEQRSIDRIHKKKSSLIYFLTEQIWLSRLWQGKDFRAFVKQADPDIFFAFATNAYLLWPMIRYVRKHTHAKIVLFAADDIHNRDLKYPFYRRCYLAPLLKKCICEADRVYAISDALCEKYSQLYSKDVHLLLKGCEFNFPVSQTVKTHLRIAYAGNLYYGRAEILAKIAKTLQTLNANGTRAALEIYTPTTVDETLDKALNVPGSSRVMGPRPYEEIKRILHDADLVLHVESFEPEQIDYVKNSFSTKIIDCLQSGSGILAVGPAGITSIEYLRQIEGTTVIDDLSSLEAELTTLIDAAEEIPNRAAAIRKYATEHHDLEQVQTKLRREFLDLLTSSEQSESDRKPL